MPHSEDSVLRGSPGVTEEDGGRFPQDAEKVGEVFSLVDLRCLWKGLGWEGKVGSEQRKQRVEEGLKLHRRIKARGKLTSTGFTGPGLLKRIGPLSFLADGGLAAWTRSMEFAITLGTELACIC